MDYEKLIECVRSCPALYNLADPKYLDTKYKNYLWRKIAVELSLSENDWISCKQRWTNIRDQYKKNLKSHKTVTGQAAKKIKMYKFSEQLQFLAGVEEDRELLSNFTERSETEPPLSPDIQSTSNNSTNLTASSAETAQIGSPLATSVESPSDLLLSQTQTNQRSKKKKSPDSASATLMKYVLENNKKRNTEREQEEHPIDAFLKGLAPTLKSFSPYYQCLAKGQIFKVIHDLELLQLNANLTSPSPSTLILSSPSPPSIPSIGSSPSPSAPTVPITVTSASIFSSFKPINVSSASSLSQPIPLIVSSTLTSSSSMPIIISSPMSSSQQPITQPETIQNYYSHYDTNF